LYIQEHLLLDQGGLHQLLKSFKLVEVVEEDNIMVLVVVLVDMYMMHQLLLAHLQGHMQ
jgi:uncharacterized membrane protein YqhA